jgi:predicted N-formylglutamate amidohydrolase
MLRSASLLPVALLTAGLVAAAAPAHAYLDPGTGSFVLQAALAAALTVGYVAKNWWRRLRDKVRPPRTDGDRLT